MSIRIQKLVPGLAEDYVRFFDTTPHDDYSTKDELPCYCVTWRNDASYASDNRHWFSTREERRSQAIQFVQNGSLQGYLAYHGGDIVGWCNANGDCQDCVGYLRSYYPIEEYNEAIKVKSIFCIVIAPKMQRMGVATKLVERVCMDAAADGFDFVEAYPNEKFDAIKHEGHGPLTMYAKLGFATCAGREGRAVARKALK